MPCVDSAAPLWTSRDELPGSPGLREDHREMLLTRATDAEPQITVGHAGAVDLAVRSRRSP